MHAGGVLLALDQLRELARSVTDAPVWQLPDEEARTAVAESYAAAQQMQATYLRLLHDLDTRPGAVPGARPGYVARTFARHALHRTSGQAKLDVDAAFALRPDADPAAGGMPRLGAALAAGEVSRDHVNVAVRAVRQIPKHLLAGEPTDDPSTQSCTDPVRCGGDVVDDVITRHARTYDSFALTRITQRLLEHADPDGARSFDPEGCARRNLRLVQDHGGMWVLNDDLDHANGALLQALLDHLAKPKATRVEKTDDGTLIELKDDRTAGQRYADALMDLVRAGQASSTIGNRGGEPPRITIITRAEDVAAARAASGNTGPGGDFGTGEPADPLLVARLSCDSIMQKVLLAPDGAVLDLGRDVRTVTPAQRRALNARDRGCVIPGCTAPARWCEAHHVTWFRHGGTTDIANLALVCERHHTEIHQGTWTLEMRDGVPWATPPDWLDDKQRPIRNSYFSDVHEAGDLGTQLRLSLESDNGDQDGDARSP